MAVSGMKIQHRKTTAVSEMKVQIRHQKRTMVSEAVVAKISEATEISAKIAVVAETLETGLHEISFSDIIIGFF
jgi:hypothetical protein